MYYDIIRQIFLIDFSGTAVREISWKRRRRCWKTGAWVRESLTRMSAHYKFVSAIFDDLHELLNSRKALCRG